MNGWLHSTGHRENILRADYRELGIGYLADQMFQGYAGATLWSQEFGVRTPASPTPTIAAAASAPTATKPVLKKQQIRHRKPRRHLHR
jgi:hypothetical protein